MTKYTQYKPADSLCNVIEKLTIGLLSGLTKPIKSAKNRDSETELFTDH